jgi:thioredoxin 1
MGVVILLAVVIVAVIVAKKRPQLPATPSTGGAASAIGLPRFIEIGSVSCIPCKMMAPILDELRKDYAGRLQVDFSDVNKDRDAVTKFSIRVIPTQVFLDASGKELFRHEGFFPKQEILAKWKELGIDLKADEPAVFERLEAAQPDRRPKDAVCYMCDGDIDQRTLVVVRTDKGDVRLCSPHCYFIMYSCLTEDTTGFQQKVAVTDYATGAPVPAADAVYVEGLDAQSGRPWIRAFAESAAAEDTRQASGGSILSHGVLQEQELSNRCGFCDRACYPQDAAEVIAGGIHALGCCSHCALGVAARTGLDIEVHQPDGLTGEMVVVKTMGGRVASLEPRSAVAWFGLRQTPDGQWASAGCFHQGFFVNEQNLRTWVEQHPLETGRMISIQQVLADKMKLTPQQIMKACKIGECAPK